MHGQQNIKKKRSDVLRNFSFHKQQQSSPTFTLQIVYTSSTSVNFFFLFRMIGGIVINSRNFIMT